MERVLAGPGPNWLLRWLVIISVGAHLGLALWVSDVVRVKTYSQIKVSMFKGKPPARALPRPRLRPQKTPEVQAANPLAAPTPPLPMPTPPRAEAPPAAPGEVGLSEALPRNTGLPAGDLAPPALQVASEEMAAYQELVRAAVARHRRYPPSARKRGLEGRAKVWFSIGLKGGLLQLKLIKSAGEKSLDQAALSAVRGAAPFPPPPAGTPKTGLAMEVILAFELY